MVLQLHQRSLGGKKCIESISTRTTLSLMVIGLVLFLCGSNFWVVYRYTINQPWKDNASTKRPPLTWLQSKMLFLNSSSIEVVNSFLGGGEGNGCATSYAVFLNLYFPPNEEQLKTVEIAAEEQSHQICASLAALSDPLSKFSFTSNDDCDESLMPTLHYITIGNNNEMSSGGVNASNRIAHIIDNVCSQYEGIMCRHVKHHNNGYEEVTLNELYDYCNESGHRSHRVAYAHNKGSLHPDGWLDPEVGQIRQDVWRRHGTAAAISEMCLRPVDNDCNVCGLLWTPIPFQHSPGNFWSSQCSYIQKLLRPSHFQILHDHLLKSTYMPLHDQGKLISTLPWGALMGGGRWSMEMWIGSHPSVRPCYLSAEPGIKHWQTRDRDIANEFNFSLFPRPEHDMRTMIKHSEPRHGTDEFDDESIRMRDYKHLPGMIMRWRLMYGDKPLPSSWMWSFYPDGKVWKNGLEEYGGEKVFEILTKQFWPAEGLTDAVLNTTNG